MYPLTGTRVKLRIHTMDDLDWFHALFNDPDVIRFLDRAPVSREVSAQLLADVVEENQRINRQRYFFTISSIATQNVVGAAGFTLRQREDQKLSADMGWYLFKDWWGKGFASEAAGLMLDYAFQNLEICEITAGCQKENFASERVMRSCGMQLIAEKHPDRVQYRINKAQWMDIRALFWDRRKIDNR